MRAAAEEYRKFAANEQLAMFLRSLESLKKELESKTVMLLDGSEGTPVRMFRDGPTLTRLPTSQPAKNGSRNDGRK